jgi:hypothetical protein
VAVRAFESMSTWRQPTPPLASPARGVLIGDVAARVAGLAPGRLRVAVDGRTCAAREGAREARRVHRDRYHAAEMIYLAEVGPKSLADLIIDNSDFTRPVIVGGRDDGGRASREEPR